MARNASRWLLLLGQLLLVPAILLFLVEGAALDRSFHLSLYAQQNAAQATGLTEEGVVRTADALIDYLRGARADLALVDEVYGHEQPVFGEREITHMADVEALFEHGRTIRLALLIAGLVLTALGLFRSKAAQPLFRALRNAALCFSAALLALVGYAALDFNRAFIAMHGLLFSNDLWLMDNSQLMIRMLPESFFLAVAGRIALVTVGGLILMIVLGAVLGRRKEGRA